MNMYRVMAVCRRFSLVFFNGAGRYFDLLYWPLRDCITWGLATTWLLNNDNPERMTALLAGVVLWQVVLRSTNMTGFALVEELVTHNMVNIASAPLALHEWIIGVMVVSCFSSLLVALFGMIVVWLLYGINLLTIGVLLIPIIVQLVIFGFSLGFIAASCVVYKGIKMQWIISALAWLFAPFVGIYYPLEVLPKWAAAIAYCLPVSYAFQAMRMVIIEHVHRWDLIGISLMLNLLYLCAALIIFTAMFAKSRQHGLIQLQ